MTLRNAKVAKMKKVTNKRKAVGASSLAKSAYIVWMLGVLGSS